MVRESALGAPSRGLSSKLSRVVASAFSGKISGRAAVFPGGLCFRSGSVGAVSEASSVELEIIL